MPRVVAVLAECELRRHDGPEADFDVSELLELDDGRRLVLHNARGFGGRMNRGDYWFDRASIESGVLTTVLPDDAEETGEEHDWEWLAELAGHCGIEITVDELRRLPYRVVYGERLDAKIAESEPEP